MTPGKLRRLVLSDSDDSADEAARQSAGGTASPAVPTHSTAVSPATAPSPAAAAARSPPPAPAVASPIYTGAAPAVPAADGGASSNTSFSAAPARAATAAPAASQVAAASVAGAGRGGSVPAAAAAAGRPAVLQHQQTQSQQHHAPVPQKQHAAAATRGAPAPTPGAGRGREGRGEAAAAPAGVSTSEPLAGHTGHAAAAVPGPAASPVPPAKTAVVAAGNRAAAPAAAAVGEGGGGGAADAAAGRSGMASAPLRPTASAGVVLPREGKSREKKENLTSNAPAGAAAAAISWAAAAGAGTAAAVAEAADGAAGSAPLRNGARLLPSEARGSVSKRPLLQVKPEGAAAAAEPPPTAAAARLAAASPGGAEAAAGLSLAPGAPPGGTAAGGTAAVVKGGTAAVSPADAADAAAVGSAVLGVATPQGKAGEGGSASSRSPSRPAAVATAAGGRKRLKFVKTEENFEPINRWWERTEAEVEREQERQWTYLEHNGLMFAPPYEPHHVPITYRGQTLELPPEAEEVAGFWCGVMESDYATKPRFVQNFWRAFIKLLPPTHTIIQDARHAEARLPADYKPGETPAGFGACDFSAIKAHFDRQKELKKEMSKEQKEAVKQQKLEECAPYAYALVDFIREKVGNSKVEPPGLFRGRGEHPKQGMLKRRIFSEDVILNLAEDAPVPKVSLPGHAWKDIFHDNSVTWLAFYRDSINDQVKYMYLAAQSKFKGQQDFLKYEKARKLKLYVDKIRKDYHRKMESTHALDRQLGTATYLIDFLALRIGGEKDTDEEADTVGCCSLRVEHLTFDKERQEVTFDFLGKDSIRYFNTVKIHPQAFKNMVAFCKGKKPEDNVFDIINSAALNSHLKQLMPGLSAKVFRTYNASITLQNELQKLSKALQLRSADAAAAGSGKKKKRESEVPVKSAACGAAGTAGSTEGDGGASAAAKQKNKQEGGAARVKQEVAAATDVAAAAAGVDVKSEGEGGKAGATGEDQRGGRHGDGWESTKSDEMLRSFSSSAKRRRVIEDNEGVEETSDGEDEDKPLAAAAAEKVKSGERAAGAGGQQLTAGKTAEAIQKEKEEQKAKEEEELRSIRCDTSNVNELVQFYNDANRAVAILCNHQRSVPKQHAASMQKLEHQQLMLDEDIRECREYLQYLRGGGSASGSNRGGKKRDSGFHFVSTVEDLLGNPRKPGVKEGMKVDACERRLQTLLRRRADHQLKMKLKDDNKTVALGTSKINYMDPRITVAFCKKYEIPIEKLFNKSLRLKFPWAMFARSDFEF